MTDQPDPPPVPTVEEANQELLVLRIQVAPAMARAAYLEGVIAGRQAETPRPAPKAPARAKR